MYTTEINIVIVSFIVRVISACFTINSSLFVIFYCFVTSWLHHTTAVCPTSFAFNPHPVCYFLTNIHVLKEKRFLDSGEITFLKIVRLHDCFDV